jgi:hypothetical protein
LPTTFHMSKVTTRGDGICMTILQASVVLQICQNISSAFYPYMHFTCPDIMAFQDSIPSDRPNLKVAHLVVGNSFSISMLNAPSHFAFMSTKLPIPPQRHKTCNPLWVMIC